MSIFCNFVISMLMILLSILSVIRPLICGNNNNWFLNLNLIYQTLWTGAKSGLLIPMLEKHKHNWFYLTGLITLVLLMWKWMGLFWRENHLLRYWGCLSLLNWIGALTLSLSLNMPPRKLEPWFVLWSFFLLRLLCMSINQPYTHNGILLSCALSYYFELLDKLQKQICTTVGPSLATSLEPLSYCWNVASLSLFYRFYFGRYSFQLAQLVPLPFFQERSTRYSDRLHEFSVTITRCHIDVYINSFFPGTARIWNSLPVECFCLTNDLNGLKSILNRHLLTVGPF